MTTMTKKNNKFDEKQILDRGKAFKIGFLASMITPAISYLIQDFIEINIDDYTTLLFMIWVPLTVCFISLILLNAYEGLQSSGGGKIFCTIFGFAGIFPVIFVLIDVLSGFNSFYQNGTITGSVGELFMGSCMIIISIVYWIKYLIDKKKFANE